MSLGSTLKEARERKGLTIAQVAEQTHMIHQLVEEIENDDFHRITAPLYGRGFVKLFAECVDEEPAPLMQEFTEIYTGLRRPGVRTRPVQTPVESPEVAEPKDRNAPPPRPKVRHVVVADDPEEPSPSPVESPKSTVESPAVAGRDAPTARPGGRFMETSLPAASKPVESPKSEVESPADTGRDAPTARPAEQVERPKSKVEGLAETATDEPKDDESLLGDLFDLVARKRSQRSGETDAPAAKSESSVKISLPQETPSWDDAPLDEDGDFWQKLYNLDKWKYWKLGAALAGLCLLSVIVFALVANRHSKPEEAEPPDESQTTAISEPQPEPQPEQVPAKLSTPNSQLSTSSAGDAAASPADGKSVYTDNLIPPPDSYVE